MKQVSEIKMNPIDKVAQKIVNAIGYLFIFIGLGIFGVQVFIFLKTGEWIKLPLLYLAALGPDNFVSWLDSPDSWLGVHKIIMGVLEIMPLSVSVFFWGLLWLDMKLMRKKPNKLINERTFASVACSARY